MLALNKLEPASSSRRAKSIALVWFVPLLALADAAASTADLSSLKIATWNLEWLVAPSEFKALKQQCTSARPPARREIRQLPCDVARRLERSSRDFAVLASYARELNADVVALQEVDGPSAARLVFPEYSFCFTGRPHVQNTGFAVRRHLPFRCGRDVHALSLGDTVRRGAELVLFPGEAREMRLLSIHLKSGCPTKPLSSADDDCRQLARQAPALEAWIDGQARAGRHFAILGDFNRSLLAGSGPRARRKSPDDLWKQIDDADPPEADLQNAAEGEPFRNCAPGQDFRSYIDHIVLSRSLSALRAPGSFSRVTYSAADAHRVRLSDHCPVALRLRLTTPQSSRTIHPPVIADH